MVRLEMFGCGSKSGSVTVLIIEPSHRQREPSIEWFRVLSFEAEQQAMWQQSKLAKDASMAQIHIWIP